MTVLTHYPGWRGGLARPETQTTEAERWRAMIVGLRDLMQKSGSTAW